MPVIYKGGGIVYNSTAEGATPPVVTQPDYQRLTSIL